MDRVRELKKSVGTKEPDNNNNLSKVDMNNNSNNETDEQKQQKIDEEKAEAKTFLLNLLSSFKLYDNDSLKGINKS